MAWLWSLAWIATLPRLPPSPGLLEGLAGVTGAADTPQVGLAVVVPVADVVDLGAGASANVG